MELRSLCTNSAIWVSVAFSFFATSRNTSMSMGFKLYRQLSKSEHVAPLLVST